MLWEEIQKSLQKEVDGLKNSLAYGVPSDYHSYMQIVGKIAGIEYAQDEIKRLVNTMIYEDEEE
jgi:hypothetical protein